MNIFMPWVKVAGLGMFSLFIADTSAALLPSLGALLPAFFGLWPPALRTLAPELNNLVVCIVASQMPPPIALVGYIVASQVYIVASQMPPPIASSVPRVVPGLFATRMAGRTPR